MTFQLNSKLKKDTLLVYENQFTHILLMNDTRYPWMIIVPKKNNTNELFQLTSLERTQLDVQIDIISKFFKFKYPSTVINVAKIGNIVKQLHIHIVARNENDPSWPNPVWGIGQSQKYKKNDAKILIEELKEYFTENYPHKD